MSPRQVVCGNAWNSVHVQRASGRGPWRSAKLHVARSTSGVGPKASTGKSCVSDWPGGRRFAAAAPGRRPLKPRVVMADAFEVELPRARDYRSLERPAQPAGVHNVPVTTAHCVTTYDYTSMGFYTFDCLGWPFTAIPPGGGCYPLEELT